MACCHFVGVDRAGDEGMGWGGNAKGNREHSLCSSLSDVVKIEPELFVWQYSIKLVSILLQAFYHVADILLHTTMALLVHPIPQILSGLYCANSCLQENRKAQ